MLEMFAVYALLLAAWGLYSQRRAAGAAEEAELVDVGPPAPATITVTRIERGDAARRHLGTTAGV
jgi:hypothetical protein